MVTAFLEASITGAGLVLAVYALITPISQKIFQKRANKLETLLKEFEKERNKITADAPEKDFNRLTKLRDEIKKTRVLPRYLGFGIALTFGLFMLSVLYDTLWFNGTPSSFSDGFVFVVFLFAVFTFLSVGIITISEISSMMTDEFEDIKKRQKEAKETTDEELEKLKKDIEELKEKEDMRVS
jgi:uncharacterized membrane protein (DUF106 family)